MPASGMIIRPRRPVVRSRADHAVTASFSRSISIWSGTSTAYAGTERAASSATTTITPHATWGAKPASSVPPEIRKTPMPAAIQTFCTSRLEAPAARVAPAAAAPPRPAMPTSSGSRSAPGCQAAANAAAAANAGAAAARCGANRPVGTTPLTAASNSSTIVVASFGLVGPGGEHAGERRPSTAATAHHSAAPIPATWSPVRWPDRSRGGRDRGGRRTEGRHQHGPRLEADRLEADRLREQPAGGRDQPGRVRQPAVRGVLTGHVGDRGAHRDEEVERAGGSVHGHGDRVRGRGSRHDVPLRLLGRERSTPTGPGPPYFGLGSSARRR